MNPPFTVLRVHSLNCITFVVLTNRYGHPHVETIERLTAEGCSILNTAECGAITLRQTGKEVANLRIIQYNRFYEKFE